MRGGVGRLVVGGAVLLIESEKAFVVQAVTSTALAAMNSDKEILIVFAVVAVSGRRVAWVLAERWDGAFDVPDSFDSSCRRHYTSTAYHHLHRRYDWYPNPFHTYRVRAFASI